MIETIEIRNLYEYLDFLEERNVFSGFVGDETLSSLYYHIKGYDIACRFKVKHEDLTPDFSLFHDFVADYYQYGESTPGWKNIILAQHYGDEKEALKKFFKLLKLFRNGYEPTKSKTLLFKFLNDWILNDSAQSEIANSIGTDNFIKIKELLKQLGSIKFSFEYDYLLKEIENEIGCIDKLK